MSRAAFAQQSLVGAVLSTGLVPENDFLSTLARLLDLPWRNEEEISTPENLRQLFPARLALGFQILPEAFPSDDDQTDQLRILIWDPFDHAAWQALAHHHEGSVELVMTTRRRLIEAVKSAYGVGAETFEELLEGRDEEIQIQREEVNVLDDEDPEASVMKFVNQILREGLQQGATDIHFEPLGHDLRIRYRIDGVLHEAPVPPRIKLLQDSVTSRLKIMASLDIAERRLLRTDASPWSTRVAPSTCVSPRFRASTERMSASVFSEQSVLILHA